MHLGGTERVFVVELERDHILRLGLVERHALALDVHGASVAAADVAEGEVGIALEREDAAGGRDLLAERLGGGDHYRLCVGG